MNTQRFSRIASAAGFAALLCIGMPGPGIAQDTVTIKPKPISATYKKIDTQVLRMDIVFTGKLGDRVLKNSKLQFDINEDRIAKTRSVTFSGAGLSILLSDPALAKLRIRSMSLLDFAGVQYVQLVGSVSVCVKPAKGDKSLIGLLDQLSPETLLKQSKLDSTSMKAKVVKAEKVSGQATTKYEVLDLNAIKNPNGPKQYLWIVDDGGYITKFEASVIADGKVKNAFSADFIGEQRVIYSIVSINKPVKIALPASCKNAIQG
jgi:CRISPR/Cas system CMR-associated protein Cmr3 (group 5 of RAMP superfamily)